MLAIGKLLVLAVYLGYAAIVYWRLRTSSEVQAETAETRSWVRCMPPWHLFADLLLPAMPLIVELTCAINGLLWPVELLTRPWRFRDVRSMAVPGPRTATYPASCAEGSEINAEQHPALSTDHDALPTLTLVLPRGLDKDQVLAGLAEAIGQVRADLAARAQLFQQRVEKYAARGDRLRQALCRGQVIGSEHAAAALDEAIIGVFDLWDQYDTQLSAAADAAPPEAQRPARGLPQ